MDQKGNAKTFVECTGITRYISVSNMQVHAWQVTDSVIRLNGGRHYSPQVDRCFTPTIQKAIECSNGAVLIEEPDTLPNPIP
jgi:hypothetical protein